MKSLTLMLLLLLFVVQAEAGAGMILALEDPANIHVNGPGGFAQSGGGTDWVTLPTFTGLFNVGDVADNGVTITPWTLILAIPNVTGTIGDSINRIGTTTVHITPNPEVTLTSGQNVYDALGIPGNNSVSFTNLVAADQTVIGGPAPTAYGLYSFDITLLGLALIGGAGPENVQLGGNLPAGTIIIAAGVGSDNKEYTTAFTNAGVTATPFASAVPEPSTFVLAGVGAACLIPLAIWRRYRSKMLNLA